MHKSALHVICLDTQCTVRRWMTTFFPLTACCLNYIVLHKQPRTLHISNQEHLMTLLASRSLGCTTTFNVVVCNAVALLYTVSPTYIHFILLSMIISSLKTRLCTYVRLLHLNLYGNSVCDLVGTNASVLAVSATKETDWLGGKLVRYGMCNLVL